jgi:hypothetical protein
MPPQFRKKAGPPAAKSSKGAVSFLAGEESPEHEGGESPAFEGGEDTPDLKTEVQKLVDTHGLEAVKGALEECGEGGSMGGMGGMDDAGAMGDYK